MSDVAISPPNALTAYAVARYAQVRSRPLLLVGAAFYVVAAWITAWALLVLLRSDLPDNADGLWVSSFAHDVLQGVPLRGWHPPGAPLYFPELSLLVLLGGLGFGVRSSLLIYGAFSWLALAGGIYSGLRIGRVPRARALRFAFAALLVYLLLHGGSGLLQSFVFPFSHGGAALLTLLGLLYIARGLERGFALPSALGAALALGLGGASDRSLFGQLLGPALAVVGVLLVVYRAPRERLFGALGILLLAALLGWIIPLVIQKSLGIHAGPFHPHFGWQASLRTLARLTSDLGQLAADRPAITLSILLPLLFLCWQVYVPLRERVGMGARIWLASAGLASVLGTLSGVIVTNVWDGPVSARYLSPLFLLPLALAIVIAVPLQAQSWQLPRGWARGAELTLLFLLVLLGTRTDSRTPRSKAMLAAPNRSCLDHYFSAEGLHAGYAGYWPARPQMLLGETQLTLAQVSRRLLPHAWADNSFWHTRGFWPGSARPRFSFVLTRDMDEPWLLARFGEPRARHSCFGAKVWVYDRPSDVEFRNYLRSGDALATGDDPTWWPADGKLAEDTEESSRLSFKGTLGVWVQLPRVLANVIEVVSPGRGTLGLSYLHDGAEVASQQVSFGKDSRRLLVLPAGVDMRSVDGVFFSSTSPAHFEVKRVALMWDPDAETLRP